MNGRTWKLGGVAAWALACVIGRSPAQAPAQPPAQAPAQPPAATVVPAGAATAAPKAAAVVNGEPIPMAELDAVLKQAGPSAVAIPDDQKKAAQRQALAMLIDETLMHQFLLQNAPAVSDAEVDK